MKIEVLIHTRTKKCDFPSQFAVSPSMIDSSSLKKVRKQILLSTSGIDTLHENQVRQLIYTCDNFVIAGMVSYLKNFADNNKDDEKFFYDIRNRGIYAFIGLVIEKEEGNQQIPVITKKFLWDTFKTNLSEIWEHENIEQKTGIIANINFDDKEPLEPSATAEKIHGVTMYVSGSDDSSIFSYWLNQAIKGKNVSFCSNITNFDHVKDKKFDIVTTTHNIIQRMKIDSSDQNQNTLSQSRQYAPMPEKKTTEHSRDHTANLNDTLVIAVGVLSFIILIMIILVIRLLTQQ